MVDIKKKKKIDQHNLYYWGKEYNCNSGKKEISVGYTFREDREENVVLALILKKWNTAGLWD